MLVNPITSIGGKLSEKSCTQPRGAQRSAYIHRFFSHRPRKNSPDNQSIIGAGCAHPLHLPPRAIIPGDSLCDRPDGFVDIRDWQASGSSIECPVAGELDSFLGSGYLHNSLIPKLLSLYLEYPLHLLSSTRTQPRHGRHALVR